MKIGALAEATGTPVETIRFYEREGLLPPPARADNNYRTYQPSHAERLAFIRRCRGLDMTLDEVRSLIKLRELPQDNCSDINALLDEHIEHVAHRIGELRALETDLKDLRAHCTSPRTVTECGILQELDSAGPTAGKAAIHRHVHGAH
ncbi:MAG: Cd(II)/Pb(II)-responsive transcriptional regulator [Pusillimonas sp.]